MKKILSILLILLIIMVIPVVADEEISEYNYLQIGTDETTGEPIYDTTKIVIIDEEYSVGDVNITFPSSREISLTDLQQFGEFTVCSIPDVETFKEVEVLFIAGEDKNVYKSYLYGKSKYDYPVYCYSSSVMRFDSVSAMETYISSFAISVSSSLDCVVYLDINYISPGVGFFSFDLYVPSRPDIKSGEYCLSYGGYRFDVIYSSSSIPSTESKTHRLNIIYDTELDKYLLTLYKHGIPSFPVYDTSTFGTILYFTGGRGIGGSNNHAMAEVAYDDVSIYLDAHALLPFITYTYTFTDYEISIRSGLSLSSGDYAYAVYEKYYEYTWTLPGLPSPPLLPTPIPRPTFNPNSTNITSFPIIQPDDIRLPEPISDTFNFLEVK